MMLKITTTVLGLDQVIKALEMLGQHKLPHLAKAVETASVMVQQKWTKNASSAFHHSTGQYLEGIHEGLRYPINSNPFAGAIINTAPHAKAVEHGTPPHDMKKALFTSKKVKISKDGKRYLIIPFRHGSTRSSRKDKLTGLQIEAGRGDQRATMTSMPKSVYAQAKALAVGKQLKGMGDFGRRTQFTQRDPKNLSRLQIRKDPETGKPNPYTWKTSPYEGMKKIKSDSIGHHYMTFRIMHEDSQGWFHPGTPPLKLAEKTAKEIKPVVKELLKEGYLKDCRSLGLVAV